VNDVNIFFCCTKEEAKEKLYKECEKLYKQSDIIAESFEKVFEVCKDGEYIFFGEGSDIGYRYEWGEGCICSI